MPTCSVNAGSQPEFRSQLNRLGQRKHKCKPKQITKNCCYSSIPTHWISEYKLPPQILWVKTEDNKSPGQLQIYLLDFQRCRLTSEASPHVPGRKASGPVSVRVSVRVCMWAHTRARCRCITSKAALALQAVLE